MEEEILAWEHSAGLHSDSDVEDEDANVDFGDLRRRHAGEFDVEELSSGLCQVLGSIDLQDDAVLRESSQDDLLHFDWSHDPDVFEGVRETFTGTSGPTFPIVGMSPFQILGKIWDEDILNKIVTETNRYASNLPLNCAQYSRTRRWTPINVEELWTFFGVVMLQSLIPIPVQKEYWAPSLPYLKIGNFNDIMPYNRFMLIKKCLHFVDNTLCARGIPKKLAKIQPILDHLNEKFSSLYLPAQEIAIDESLLLWKGRLSFSQVIATKAAQVGIKSYELCESKSGYLWSMNVYAGKNERHDGDGADSVPEGSTSRTVLKLVGPLLNRGHTLVMDNFYNSPLLTRTLKAQKTDVMGTLRLNREFVPESLRRRNKANMRSGEVAFSQTKDMTITVWKDANVVAMISSYHRVEVGGKEKYGYYKYKPKVILDYNLSMGGVDKKDQLLQAFPIERVRNPVWYKKLFYRLLNVSIHNAFVMYQHAVPGHVSHRQFRVMLADEIIQRFRPPTIHVIPPNLGHFPVKTQHKRSRCKWCALKKIDSSTVYKCEACNALNTFLELYAEAAGEQVPEYQALVRDYPQLLDTGMKRQDVVHSFLRFGRRR
uniref:PiggyBac transposable element-derived protein domain-containing protein n=1 Tax=Heliothis virescens TaxID=7102 RepID=A0A2A4IY54_HELVI